MRNVTSMIVCVCVCFLYAEKYSHCQQWRGWSRALSTLQRLRQSACPICRRGPHFYLQLVLFLQRRLAHFCCPNFCVSITHEIGVRLSACIFNVFGVRLSACILNVGVHGI